MLNGPHERRIRAAPSDGQRRYKGVQSGNYDPVNESNAIADYMAYPVEPWRGFNRTPEERAKAE